jgi:type I restriction enzyme R subunit
MMSQFDFLEAYPYFEEVRRVCREAEQSIAVSNATCALQSRRALEVAVKWMYRYDKGLTVPYDDRLSALIHDVQFKTLIDSRLFPRLKFVILLGNKAAHTAKAMRRDETELSLKNLYDFVRWLAFTYAKAEHRVVFDVAALPDGFALEKRTQAMQQELAAKEAAWAAERAALKDELRSAQERAEFATARETHDAAFDCDDISEFKTRKIYIDLALQMAGWEIGTNGLEEVEVQGMPNPSGTGFADYVLYADNGLPLAVVEAKRTSVDPQVGKVQAKLYADCLEKQHGVRPLIYTTNGFTTYFRDDAQANERTVFGFFTKAELDAYNFRKQHRVSLKGVTTKDEIAGRVYQKKAVQAVCDNLERGQRKSLLVMATGSGKTRTAISLVEVLQRHGWIKNILFLADRRELVKQAKKNFAALLPNLSICNLLDGKDDPTARMVFSTYPTMMNAIDSTKREDGSTLFTCGHFDLVIVDESHRSIYRKYQDIFTYFDSYLLGLTATPKSDIDKNTYSIFDIENDVPSFAYELGEAIAENYLVPYRTVETSMKFMEQGIHYDDLSPEEQEHWEETFDEGLSDIPGEALNKFLFNDHTVDTVLQTLMEKGIKVAGGDQIGKTVIFAANTKHAEFILKRFNALYPEYPGQAAAVYNGIKYVDSVIEELGEKDKNPRIAVSVDMLDTGIDIPELVNLVFFKRVRSKSKFWQMIGRGTRLCENLFGGGQDKTEFVIFDYCGNFEYFRAEKNGKEARAVKSLSENLFNIRVRLAQELQHSDHQTGELIAYRDALVEELHAAVCAIDETRFYSRMRIEFIHRYNQRKRWQTIPDEMLRELERQIAPLVPAIEDDELAKRFDYLMYTIEYAALRGEPVSKPRMKVQTTAEKLDRIGNLPQVKRQAAVIAEVQTEDFWQQADTFDYERVRLALRDLIRLLESSETAPLYYTSFTDEVLGETEHAGEYGSDEFQSYRKKVDAYLRDYENDLVVHKLRFNKELTEHDCRHLEHVLWEELGSEADYRREFGDEPLLKLVAGMVGLDMSAANALFSEFINDQTLDGNQLEFVQRIVRHIVANGYIEKSALNEHPFTRHGTLIDLFEGKVDVVQEIVKRIDQLNGRVAI